MTDPHVMITTALWMGTVIGFVLGMLVASCIFSAARAASARWRCVLREAHNVAHDEAFVESRTRQPGA